MKNRQLHAIAETICQRGCSYVNAILRDAEKRAACKPLNGLDERERECVLSELKAVMSVYNKTGSCDI